MNRMLYIRSPKSANIKIALLVIAILIVLGTLYYTQRIVDELVDRQREIADLYAKSLEYVASEKSQTGDLSFVFDEIIRAIDFPIIVSDPANNPIPGYHKNVPLDSAWSEQKTMDHLRMLIRQMDEKNPPIRIVIDDTLVIQHVHFGEAELITTLRWLPYIEIAIAAMFVLIGYVGFSYIKRSEQSNIWVGMAKETAHQLGTPLSSIMGWIEILRMHANGNPKLTETVTEMETDIRRLEKITSRFSKIGSKPELREENLNEVIEHVIQYFKKRIPRTGKDIELIMETKTSYTARINRELFEWVIENLLKNALDAMEDGTGRICFTLSQKGNAIYVDVTDTGKGIDFTHKKDVFRPGFSTKKRGWGLGLTLSKRIIESYHRGKLIVKESKPGKGTTFRIKLAR
ncbi:MAG: HAMP domain-containing sensor histidine kinase [Bacteroidota bacterium]